MASGSESGPEQEKKKAIERLRKLRRPLPPGFVFNREEANLRQAEQETTVPYNSRHPPK
ncbi:MAG: hypothetical protein WCC27_18615 [Acidobacteriaceae bacterium]